jgi:hypothetical protein
MTSVLPVAVALVPVLLFLAGLQLMDSFKLVRIRAVVTAIAAGSPPGCSPRPASI